MKRAKESGYTPCACRDCMETAISDDMSKPDMCHECQDAGCEPDSECQVEPDYDVDERERELARDADQYDRELESERLAASHDTDEHEFNPHRPYD